MRNKVHILIATEDEARLLLPDTVDLLNLLPYIEVHITGIGQQGVVKTLGSINAKYNSFILNVGLAASRPDMVHRLYDISYSNVFPQ